METKAARPATSSTPAAANGALREALLPAGWSSGMLAATTAAPNVMANRREIRLQ